jgi:hypothetical protein
LELNFGERERERGREREMFHSFVNIMFTTIIVKESLKINNINSNKGHNIGVSIKIPKP